MYNYIDGIIFFLFLNSPMTAIDRIVFLSNCDRLTYSDLNLDSVMAISSFEVHAILKPTYITTFPIFDLAVMESNSEVTH